jgi:hypothetical protein
MPHNIIVTNPDDKDRLPEVALEVARLQNEVQAIEACGDEKACRVCGVETELTEEHTPSKKAGNPPRLVQGSVDYEQSVEAGEIVWKTELIQGGAKVLALCGPCNNSTGRWYNPAYVRLAQFCQGMATPENAGKLCEVRLEIHRQRVAKQALTTLVATSQPGITGYYSHLRRLLCDAEARGALRPLRLWMFLRANWGARVTGMSTTVSYDRRRGYHLAEFSFWPLGWILTFADDPIEGAVDVSEWVEFDYHDKGELRVDVPCQWTISPSTPGDFRPPAAFGVQWPPPA